MHPSDASFLRTMFWLAMITIIGINITNCRQNLKIKEMQTKIELIEQGEAQ